MAEASGIAKAAASHVAGLHTEKPNRETLRRRLESERVALEKKLRLIYATAGDESEASLKDLVDDHLVRLKELRSRIADLLKAPGVVPDAEEIVSNVEQQLRSLGRVLSELPVDNVRRLLAILVRDLKVDLETRDFEFEVALPSWAMQKAEAITRAVGLSETTSRCRTLQTHGDDSLSIARFSCRQPRRRSCYECTRVAAATAA
jgi:hypothetical protein